MTEAFLGFFPIGQELAIQEVMERASRTYKPTYFALMRLVERGYLLRRRDGWKHLFRLNLANPFVRKMVEMQELERLERLAAQLGDHGHAMVELLLDRVTEEVPVLAAVTMAPPRVEETPKGPVKHLTVYFVVPHQNGYGADIRKACDEVSAINGLRLKAVVASRQTYRRILRGEDEPETREALTQGVPLLGQEFLLRERLRTQQPPATLNAIVGENGHTNGHTETSDAKASAGRAISAINVALAPGYPVSPLGIRRRR